MSFNEKSDSSIQDSMGYLKLTNGIKQLNGEKINGRNTSRQRAL